ncbi:hypothetical protein QLQ12_27415 [Actinoplanes sp. NEAU-A12]|uniref:WD40 repeat protein n=1 Tax=Actinoplanes sandaracinus TaxID=3045177 RepID=A0ABT6WRJ2_9ACTN|nr:hypothetical protein [Actinoplanes sandaracinus]MDI6102353.1 hypothetical protein [Actinoplanes sandaracinus]
MSEEPRIAVFPVGIGAYQDSGLQDLAVDPEIERVCRSLAVFGGRHVPWPAPMRERGGDAVVKRLTEWRDGEPDSDTVLYWAGHGWSNNEDAALAHHLSPAHVGVSGLRPDVLAAMIADRQSMSPGSWAVVVVEACRSSRFVELVESSLSRMPHSPGRVLLIGVSGAGSIRLGTFADALAHCLENTFRAAETIELWDLARQLERTLQGSHVVPRRLGESALRRVLPSPATPPIAVDVDDELKRLLADLPDDVRRHFLTKAQGGETGELLWYFEGRERQLAEIASWLRTARSGMLVVTGPPGSGKSALLGQAVALSQPGFVDVMTANELIGPVSDEARPPADVFDTALLLTGLTAADAIGRIAADLRLGAVPAALATVGAQLRWLTAALSGVRATLLFDALDEAQQPIVLAGRILPALAAVPGVRVIVGTRRSTLEGPDLPPPVSDDLLEALGRPTTVEVPRDTEAVRRYVRRRVGSLTAATPEAADRIAAAIAARRQHFLYARLAVHEVAARPDLLFPGSSAMLAELLNGGHRGLFAAAVKRMSQRDLAYPVLLRALSLGLGRGLPIRDGIWELVASALPGGETVEDAAISGLLRDAAPYLMVDVEAGQSVYRLAHRTFQEHLLNWPGTDMTVLHRRILGVLLSAGGLNPYVVHHLAGHAAQVGTAAWGLLAWRPDVLDELDPAGVVAAVAGLGDPQLPPAVAAVHTARGDLITADRSLRRVLRHLAMARTRAVSDFRGESARPGLWCLRWANLTPYPRHGILHGHDGTVRAITALTVAGGRPLLVSGGSDHTVRLWNPATGVELRQFTGHTGPVLALAMLPGRVLASAGADAVVRLWEVDTGVELRRLIGHAGPVHALAVCPDLVVSAGDDATVRLWDPGSGAPVKVLRGHSGAVRALAVLSDRVIASAGEDGTIRFWDLDEGDEIHEPIAADGVLALAALPGVDGRNRVAAVGRYDGVRVWNPLTGAEVEWWRDHVGGAHALAVLRTELGETVLASGGTDRAVRFRSFDGDSAAAPLAGHTGGINALVFLPGRDRRRLASAGADQTIRIWRPRVTAEPERSLSGEDEISALARLRAPDGRDLVVSAGAEGVLQLWDPETGAKIRRFDGQANPGSSLAVLSATDGRTVIAAAGAGGRGLDARLRLWDSATGHEIASFGGLSHPVMAVLPGHGGLTWLAVAGSSTVRIWDPIGRTRALDMNIGHSGDDVGWVRAMAAVPGRRGRTRLVTAGTLGDVRWWDPVDGSLVARTPANRDDGVRALAALPGDGGPPLLAAAGDGGVARLWNAITAAPAGELSDAAGRVTAMTAVPGTNGRALLAIASDDGVVRLWDPRARSRLAHLPCNFRINALAWAGGSLLIAGSDGLLAARIGLMDHHRGPPAPRLHPIGGPDIAAARRLGNSRTW